MVARLNPYLNFRDKAREALAFYQSVFGGDLQLMTYAQGGMSQGADDAEKIMHGQLDTPTGFTLMASDVPPSMPLGAEAGAMSVSLSGEEENNLRSYWDGLAAGATITQPLVAAPWGDTFGMLKDKFGVPWMVNIAGKRD